jgi:hypothetical protein
MTTDPADERPANDPFDFGNAGEERELPVEELLRRGRPMPPLEETAIPDLTDEEWDEFMAAIKR